MTDETTTQVLITCLSGYGHVEKLRAIASGLVQRGYPVTFTTASVYRKGIEAVGARFVPLQGTGDVDMDRLDESHPEFWSMPPGKARHEFAFKTFVVGPVEGAHRTVQDILSEYKSQGQHRVIILHDTGFLGNVPILLGAPGIRAPVIGIGTARLAMQSIDTPPFNSGLPPDSSDEGRKRNQALQKETEENLSGVQNAFIDIVRSVGVPQSTSVPFYMDAPITTPDRFLQMSIASIEYERSDMPPNLRFIGAVANTGGGKTSAALGAVAEDNNFPSWWDEVLAHKKPLIVVSQGSKSTDAEELIMPTIRALADKDVLVVATLVTVKSLGDLELPSNVRSAKFIPFHELFKHTDIAITNGGYGAVQQALYCGVPMVLSGEGKDHTATNARVAWSGAAINLASHHASTEDVRNAVEKILPADSKYRKRAAELAQEYRSHPDPIGTIAATIDELAAGL